MLAKRHTQHLHDKQTAVGVPSHYWCVTQLLVCLVTIRELGLPCHAGLTIWSTARHYNIALACAEQDRCDITT